MKTALLAVLSVVVLLPTATADVVVGRFEGVVTETQYFGSAAYDPALFIDGGVFPGDRLVARLRYDTTSASGRGDDHTGNRQFSAVPPDSGLSMQINHHAWLADASGDPPIALYIQNDFVYTPVPDVQLHADELSIFGGAFNSEQFPVHQNLQELILELRMVDEHGTLVDSGELPTSLLLAGPATDYSWYAFSICSVSDYFAEGYCIRGNLDYASLESVMQVAIDVLPQSAVNRIQVNGRRLLPVAVLSSTDFLAFNEVDTATVRFGPDAAAATRYLARDVDRDAVEDLLLFFKADDTGIACGQVELTLTGKTHAGQPFTGRDAVRVDGC